MAVTEPALETVMQNVVPLGEFISIWLREVVVDGSPMTSVDEALDPFPTGSFANHALVLLGSTVTGVLVATTHSVEVAFGVMVIDE